MYTANVVYDAKGTAPFIILGDWRGVLISEMKFLLHWDKTMCLDKTRCPDFRVCIIMTGLSLCRPAEPKHLYMNYVFIIDLDRSPN